MPIHREESLVPPSTTYVIKAPHLYEQISAIIQDCFLISIKIFVMTRIFDLIKAVMLALDSKNPT
jgi:hypothetical protein